MTGSSDNEKLRDLEDSEGDVSYGVASDLHNRTFDELLMEYSPLTPEEAAHVYWYAFNPNHSTMLLRYIARGTDMSFNAITQTALAHGFAIFKHRYAEIISMLESLDDGAIVDGNEKYLKFSDYHIMKPVHSKRLQTRTDMVSSEALGQLAATIRCNKAHLAGICILLSVHTCMLVPSRSKVMLTEQLADFDTHMALKKNHALAILSL